VSGTIGDGALGLLALTGRLPPDAHLAERYRLPRPRLALGARLPGLARAVMDVSDGLVQDLGHLARAGGCSAVIESARIPLSPAAAPRSGRIRRSSEGSSPGAMITSCFSLPHTPTQIRFARPARPPGLR
jgi:thiamine monophosphate kinase